MEEPPIRLWHGWQRAPLEALGSHSSRTDASRSYPYFGILPRGLLRCVGERDDRPPRDSAAASLDVRDWARIAPALERSLSGAEPFPPSDPVCQAWLAAARSRHVLSVGRAARVCAAFAVELAPQQDIGSLCGLDLWLIKEGHTSSVWRCELDGSSGRTALAVNVARDADGGEELAAAYEHMRTWHDSDPEHVAAPLAIDRRTLPGRSGSPRVVVTAHAWAVGRELHARPMAGRPEQQPIAELVEIDGFVPEPDTGRLRAVGRVLPRAEQQRVWNGLLGFLERHRRVRAGGQTLVPAVEVNDGDLVWCSGSGVLRVVAASAAPRALGEGEWQRFLASPYLEASPGGPHLLRPLFPRV